ncbi:hypothetical protein GCM10022297_14180 [Lactobacillus hamsteri]|uniref:Uncharacterized protein n=1 Tax=Lactobacillus hamsteri DSM 5661 = JCM 6256 TaxID=1423754 RepID=A0A0R1YCC4_9LACO|nr:hypothetical protein [Lactobacillus hamsteri]KRM40200.1 hypothetical protein FC39_GL000814 [Lactobacillus hamsteri DSM 5661 = JCM 6256]
MKKWIIRVVAAIMTFVSLYLLLLSPTTLKINNTHQMAKNIIHRVVSESGNNELKMGIKMVEDSGLEDILLQDLPKKYKINFSYADVYHLSSKYDEKGKITAKDLNLKSDNNLTKVINSFLIKEINNKLDEESTQVYHIISIYRYSLVVIVLLYILAAVLLLFGRYSASIPLLIGSIGTFGALWYFVTETSNEIHSKIYEGISINISDGVFLGLAISIIIACVWPFLLKYLRKSDKVNA